MPDLVPAGQRATAARWPAPSGWLERDALGCLGVWSLIALASAAVACQPAVTVAVAAPPIALAVAAVSGVVGLALLQLEVVRFRAFGRPLDLLVGVGFGTSATASLLISILVWSPGLGVSRLDTLTMLTLVTHGLVYVILGLAVLQAGRVVSPVRRVRATMLGVAAALLALGVGSAVVVWLGPTLPPALGPRVRVGLELGQGIPDLLDDGQAVWLLGIDAVLAVLLVVATYGMLVLAKHQADGYLGALALGLSLLALSQVHALLFPPGAPGYVSMSDLLWVAASLVLLFRLVSQVTRDVAERASTEERLRLSRELHDGLAQQLSVLNLRLSQAIRACPDVLAGSLGHDLQASRRLAQTALLEARQGITALRAGRIAWEDFVEALEAFCTELSHNQGVDVGLSVEGSVPALDAELQVEVLRMLNETISNALRHGEATRIDVGVVVERQPTRLVLRVQDDGRGAVPGRRRPGAGVGLRSLAERAERRGGTAEVRARPPRGTVVQIQLPLPLRNCRTG